MRRTTIFQIIDMKEFPFLEVEYVNFIWLLFAETAPHNENVSVWSRDRFVKIRDDEIDVELNLHKILIILQIHIMQKVLFVLKEMQKFIRALQLKIICNLYFFLFNFELIFRKGSLQLFPTSMRVLQRCIRMISSVIY